MQERHPGIWIGLAVALAVLVVAISVPSGTQPPPPTPAAPAKVQPLIPSLAPAVPAENGQPLSTAPAAPRTAPPPPRDADAPPPLTPAPATIPATVGSVRQAIDDLHFSIRDFRTTVGGNPVGTNAEITGALLGDNIKQVKIPIPPGTSLSAERELCDAWGRPYFFHQISGTKMEIRSAGADGLMWTADDIQQ